MMRWVLMANYVLRGLELEVGMNTQRVLRAELEQFQFVNQPPAPRTAATAAAPLPLLLLLLLFAGGGVGDGGSRGEESTRSLSLGERNQTA